MKSLKGKRSLFNRVYTLNNNRSIVGHLSHDSLFDLYVEIDDENNTYINELPSPQNSILNNKNLGKYLKKGIEYSINFTVDHMFKLEPGFDAEVTIYE